MNPGKIDRRAQYHALVETTGPAGAPRCRYAAAFPLWVGNAQVRATLPAESQGGRRTEAYTVFRARYDARLKAGGRLRVDGVTFDVIGVAEAPDAFRRTEVHLTCRSLEGAQPLTPP